MWVSIFVCVTLVGAVLALFLINGDTKKTASRKSENDKLFRDGVGILVDNHIETLARQRVQLIKIERYGVTDTSAWDAEIQHFIDKVLFPDLVVNDNVVMPHLAPKLVGKDDAAALAHVKKMFNPILREIVEEKAKLRAAAIESDLLFSKDMTPSDFERWCTKTISSNGWRAITTKATGDQGADVIAEKGRTRLVLQCKLYNSPVGNKAVQEAFAAQRHYQANASAVVTNARFTASAMALAATTGVQLR